MPTLRGKSAAKYLERAHKLRLAAEIALHDDTRHQLLVSARDYEELADDLGLIDQDRADD